MRVGRVLCVLSLASASVFGQLEYAKDILPILQEYGCADCHGGNGGLFVTPYQNLMTTGDHGPVVVAGDTNSIIVQKLKGIASFGARMPFGGDPIAPGDLATITQWIKEGAKELAVTSSAGSNGNLPLRFSLGQNYPNPFNPSTSIPFSVPERSHVVLEVCSIAGEVVSRPLDAVLPAGEYVARFSAASLSSGVYFYRLTAGSSTSVKRMVLLR